MSRPWIRKFIGCSLIALMASTGTAQEYLDLPDEPQDYEPSLSERFSSITDKFKFGSQQPNSADAKPKQRSRPTAPRYRNTARATMAAQRARRERAKQAQQQQQQPQGTATNTAPKPKSNVLLPQPKLFSRSNQPQPSKRQQTSVVTPTKRRPTQELTRATKLPSADNAKVKVEPPRIARKAPTRKSPATSRSSELDAALADLLNTKPVASAKPTPLQTAKRASSRPGKQKSPARTASLPSTTFDLRKALQDNEEEDKIAAEAAEAVEEAIEAKVADKQATTAQPPETKTVPQVVKQETKAQPAPAVIHQPKQTEKIATQTTPPEITKPLVIQQIEKPTLPKQTIKIATPAKQPSFSEQVQRKSLSDPFENTAKQVFDKPNQPSNPMRPFQPVIAPPEQKQALARPASGVLQTTQQPVIVSHVEGPRSILVGREATYQVTLENTSSTQASDLSAEINVPEWAELVDAMSTSGVVERQSNGANAGALVWRLQGLAPRSSQALRLRLIPRTGRPLQLGVRWSMAPVQSQAVVEVQEPKLELAISGPQEVRYGKPQRYRLTLRNPGTGLTEEVTLRLTPPGGDQQSTMQQQIGDLKPGQVKDIDLELTAREAGELLIQAAASSAGGLQAQTSKSVLCRKPELEVDWRGPDKKYAGTVAAYYFRVRNPGTAATEPVEMSVKLPAGAEFVDASQGFSVNAATGVVRWRLASIDVDEEQFMQLRCKIARPGVNDFEVRAQTNDKQLQASKAFHTDVVALADLKLEVTDPQGPLPLGESVAYEIRVRNRGTTNAEHINIVGLFSEGIDPTTVEGAQYSVRDGRVSFHPIKSLPAGREVLLRIHAKANQVGTHIFRTEVTCPKLDIKLAAEETTRFFEDEHRWEDGQSAYTAEHGTSQQR